MGTSHQLSVDTSMYQWSGITECFGLRDRKMQSEHEVHTHVKWFFIILMDLLGAGILILFLNEPVQDSDGAHKERHIYLYASWFDKDSYSELLQRAQREPRCR